ncbi:alpha/beta fold hydrolase [Luteibacter sp. CQ10]|uniref:alpha/beta fold hydrolase n=1 Tax=Luteibacter sp. CQ10 TaxID=2805821 RepID=UPI0034A5A09F
MFRRFRHTTIAGTLCALALSSPSIASQAPDIRWGPCEESLVGTPSGVLGDRLQCGVMNAPLDHVAPDGRTIDVEVVRIRAAHAAEREGVIAFNRGGPGALSGKLLRSLAESWSTTDADDPAHGDKRRLAERFDLIAVVPRGLRGAGAIRCVTGLPPRFAYLPTHLDDANWRLVMEEGQAIADACSAPYQARYVNTEQHAHDMDWVRRALGDDRIHIYGISYGGRVAAWYASMYPAHAGRLLLDSSMDFTHDYRAAVRMSLAARQASFVNDTVGPLLDDPSRFGLGNDADAVEYAIAGLPDTLREKWAGRLTDPVRLAAALRVTKWWRDHPQETVSGMSRLLEAATFSPDPSLHRRIRWEAIQAVAALYTPPPTRPGFVLGPEGDSVRVITACNDVPWLRDESDIRWTALSDATRYVAFTGLETLEEVTCSRWGGASARQPDLAVLERAAPFLLLQSEKDSVTPLQGASFILDRFANAHMLLVKDSAQHALFNFTTSSCIERTASHYLLTGELPATSSRVLACDDRFIHPIHALPGPSRPPTTAPVPADRPAPAPHDEL